MGLGDTWGTREELLHPRDSHGRFRTKWKMAENVAKKLIDFLARFNPRTFPNDAAAGAYLQNKAKPGRFGGGAEYPRLTADFHAANTALRAGEMDPETRRFVGMMDASSIEAPDDLILTRTVGPEAFGLTPETMHLEEGGAEDLTSRLMADRGYGFAEAGTPQQGAPGTIRITYAVPKGTKIIPRARGGGDRGVFLDRDQEFRVTKVSPDGRGGYYVMAVATERTPGETPEPIGGPSAAQVTPEARQASIEQSRQIQAQRMGAGEAERQQRIVENKQGLTQHQETPEERAARRQQLLAQRGGQAPAPAPGAPTPEASPATTPATPAEVPTLPRRPGGRTPRPEFRQAVREAQLPAPSTGPRRSEWNHVFLGLATGSKEPEDALREIEADIAANRRRAEDLRAQDSGSDLELENDIAAQEALRDLIKKHFNLGGEEKPAEPVKATKKAAKKAAPEVPAKKVAKAAKAAVPPKAAPAKKAPAKKAQPAPTGPVPAGFKRVSVGESGHGFERLHEGTPAPVAPPVSREGREAVGTGHFTPVKKSSAPPREVAEPVNRKGRIIVSGEGATASHATPTKREAGTPLPVAKAAPKKVNVSKEGREEDVAGRAQLDRTIESLPEGSQMRRDAEKLRDQIDQDFQDDEVVKDWIKGSGVQERQLTEAERAHVARVARDVRTGKIDPAEGAKDLRSTGNERLAKIANRVEGGAAVRTPRTKKEKIDELDSMTSPELKAVAKQEGIKGYSKLNKEAIKKAIRDKRGGVGEAAAPEAPAGDAIDQMNVTDLRKAAKEAGIKGYSRMKKEDLQKAIREKRAGAPTPEAPAPVKAAERAAAPVRGNQKIEQARAEQAAIDADRRTARAVAEIDERLGNNDGKINAPELTRTIDNMERSGQLDAADAEAWRQAVASGDPVRLRDAIETNARAAGLSPIGSSADKVPFNPREHKLLNPTDRPGPGESVEIVRQGHRNANGDVLEKAVVQPTGEPVKVPERPKGTPGDAATARVLDSMPKEMRDQVLDNMTEKQRAAVRDSVARATGEILDPTDQEIRDLEAKIEARVNVRHNKKTGNVEIRGFPRDATADDIREAARREGIDNLAGDTPQEVMHNAFREIVAREVATRKVAKKAAKAAPPKRPADAYENLDIKEIGKGIPDLELISPGVMQGLQEDLDSGKKTPSKIGAELHGATLGSVGPGYRRAVLHGVSITKDRERIRDLEAQPPSADRDEQLAYWRGVLAENEAESEKLTREINARLKLAERLKATRRKRATAPKPEPATLTPKEEARAAEVADLAGVPKARVQARMRAQKEEKAPASDAGKHIADLLSATTTREEGEALLKGKTRDDLVDIAKAHGVPVGSRDTKKKLTEGILDSVDLRRGSRAIAEMTRGMMHVGTPRSEPASEPIRMTENPHDPTRPTVTATNLVVGERIMAMPGEGGAWTRTSRKTGGAKPITVSRIGRTTAGRNQQSAYVIHGRDDDGNEVTLEPVFGQNTLTRAPKGGTTPAKKTAQKAAPTKRTIRSQPPPTEHVTSAPSGGRPVPTGVPVPTDTENAQEAVPLRWDYRTKKTEGADLSPETRAALDKVLRNWVYAKEPGRMGPDGIRENNAEPRVNAALRKKIPTTPELQQEIDAVDEALDRSRTTRDATVFRGFTNGEGIIPDDWQERDLTGLSWDSPAFVSFTQSRDAAETYTGFPANRGFAIRMVLPKGSRAIAIGDEPGGLDDEGEIMLPRGMKFRVVKDNGVQGDYGIRWLDVEAVPVASPAKKTVKRAAKAAAPAKAAARPERSQNIGDFTPADIMKMSIPELRDLAVHRGIAGAEDMKKDDLLEKLLDLLG